MFRNGCVRPSWQYTQFQLQVFGGTVSTPRDRPSRREGTGPKTKRSPGCARGLRIAGGGDGASFISLEQLADDRLERARRGGIRTPDGERLAGVASADDRRVERDAAEEWDSGLPG